MSSEESHFYSSSDAGELSTSSAVPSSFHGTDTNSVTSVELISLSPLGKRLQGIEGTIDRLYRLSLMIRQPSIAEQNAKAEKVVIFDEEGNDITTGFTAYAYEVTAHKFPEAPQQLKERLARGIVIRRKRFLYRQRHQQKLNNKTVVVVNVKEEGNGTKGSDFDVPTVRGIRMLTDQPPQEAKNTECRPRVQHIPSQTSASVMKADITIEKVMVDEESRQSTMFTTAVTRTEPVLVPSAPQLAPGSKEFECPYCCIILPINYARAKRWRFVEPF